jgi:hypothetical protein
MGARRAARPSSRPAKETRRASSPRFAHDHLERRQSPRSSRVNCRRLALPRRFVVAAAVSAATSGERTPLACWFESLAVASRPLQRRLAETNLNPIWSAKHTSETAVIFQFFGIGE